MPSDPARIADAIAARRDGGSMISRSMDVSLQELIVSRLWRKPYALTAQYTGCAQTKHRVVFVVFDGWDHPPEYGRGYGEFRLIDHAMGHSRRLRQLGQWTLDLSGVRPSNGLTGGVPLESTRCGVRTAASRTGSGSSG
jgi:hypothetical protein